jgi:NitT/TauT family transport system substrate-binding protein
VAIGTAVDFFLDNTLVLNGIPKKDVEKVNLPPEKMLGPLLNGEIDGAVHWEPYAHELVTALGANAFTHSGRPTYNKYTWNLVAQKGWIDKNPDTVRKVIQAIIQGANFIKKNPSEARKIVARYSKMNETEISRLWGSTVFKVALHPSLLMGLEDQARWAVRNQYTAAKAVPNFLNYIYFEGLAAVEPAAVTIVH